MLFVLGDILSCERCGLVIDQIMVNSSINSIGEGILMLFASYFILNIAYPNEIGATLEFIQRYTSTIIKVELQYRSMFAKISVQQVNNDREARRSTQQ